MKIKIDGETYEATPEFEIDYLKQQIKELEADNEALLERCNNISDDSEEEIKELEAELEKHHYSTFFNKEGIEFDVYHVPKEEEF